jgi:hypothetical protein
MMFLERKRAAQRQWADRGWYLVTEFEKTPSINFRRALEVAETHPGFVQLMDERNVLIYRNLYRPDQLEHFHELYPLIKKWKGTRLYFKGDLVDFDLIESGVRCYLHTVLRHDGSGSRCQSFADAPLAAGPTALGCLGCRRSDVSMDWPPAPEIPGWFYFGRLDQHRTHVLDKEKLHDTAFSHLIEYSACPRLDLDQANALIQALPERIDPRKDREWVYARASAGQEQRGPYPPPAVVPASGAAYRAYLQRILKL